VAGQVPVTIVNSINPFRLQGQKTAAFEICEALGTAPDYHCLPVGNAGNISAYWMGYTEYAEHGIVNNRPVMVGYQASGAAPFVVGRMIDHPETVATAIRIGHPQSWDKAWRAQKESGGWFDQCSDEEILAAQQLLAQKEGIYCEPASAISIAGLLRDVRAGRIPAGSRIVCTLTGHGLKDPDIALKQTGTTVTRIPAELGAVREAIVDRLG
jgi:threonine synthase